MAKAKKAANAVIDFVTPKKASGALPSAPEVMTRSQITDLANAIKNREGAYGVRRVERAADEIPNLERLYTQQALADAFSGDNARALMTMNPADFERYAAPIGDSFKLNIYQPEQGRRLQARGEGLLPPITGDEYIKHLAQIKQQGGFSDIPYLNVNKEEQGLPDYPFISGHEGRHRNRAMAASGEQAGLVQFLPRAELREPFPRRMSEQYIDAIRKEMGLSGNFVLPQKYHIPSDTSINDVVVNRPAIELPDLYAQGGIVDSAPEEAIKNTIKDPQAFRMLDMDLANLALMSQQPQRRMAQGGQVQRFDEGGQASQDRMRYELERNSPVMQATPRGAIQDAIGTFGGYMDRAGKFVSEAIAPTAEKHPVKHFLANMLLADSLKGAGTLMQDLTGTAREADEDNPVRGIIDKDWRKLSTSTAPLLDPRALDLAGFVTPVVKGATKLGEAGAKAITPFAKSTAEMAAELYGSGKMTGMVNPAMNVVKPYYHGSDVKGLTVLDPKFSDGRRPNGSSVWVNPIDLEAASYAKKKSGSLYEVPLDTEGFAIVDANFTSNKFISPDAVIQHSNGEMTPVSALGDKVTTDDIAAYSRAKGDPGVRILNVGDMGSGRLHTDATHGESVAVHSPVEVKSERNVKDLISENSKEPKSELTRKKKDGGKVSFAPNIDAMRHELTKAK